MLLGHPDFGSWLRSELGCRVQKISVNAGFSCPNRDGRVGHGGCTFCNNQSFNPDYCATEKSVTQQLEEGKQFFARKYPEMKYLAYFQAYTNTYGSLEHCKALYEEALRVDGVVGLVIGTRPDCMPEPLLDYLSELNRRTFLIVEYGLESMNDDTLLRVNRGHSVAVGVDAIRRTAECGIRVGAHIILGLPGEDSDELMRQAEQVAQLPLTTLKLHQLQIIRDTRMAHDYEQSPESFHIFSVEEYARVVVDYVSRLPQSLVLERFVSQSPADLVIAPHWGMKNHEFTAVVQKMWEERNS